MNHRRLLRAQDERNRKVFVEGPQFLNLTVPLGRPVAIPYAPPVRVNPGNSWARTVYALDVTKRSPVQIAQGEMRHVDVAEIPYRRFQTVTAHALAEKSQLKPEVAPVTAGDVAGVIPPFRLVIGVIEVIPGELVMVARERGLELSQAGLPPGHREHASHESILHAQPRADRAAPQSTRGRSPRQRLPGKRPSARPAKPPPASESGSSNRTIAC